MKIKERINKLFFRLSQFFKFCIVGLSNTLISYAMYSLLVYINTYYILASILAFVISMVNSFYWNNKYVFTGHGNFWLCAFFKMFCTYAATGLLLHNALLFLLVEYLSVSKYIAPILLLVVTIPLNFFVNKYWSFKKEHKNG